MNFPTRHPLYGAGSIADADVVLGLEVSDFWNATHAQTPVNRMGMETRRDHETWRETRHASRRSI